jgi:hypothetical protein
VPELKITILLTCLVLTSPIGHTAHPPGLSEPHKPLFSEDFESGAIDPKVWSQVVTGDNVLTVQEERVAHGKYALLARCPAPSHETWAFIMAKNLPPELRRHHFGRAYVYITPKLPARHTIFLTAGTTGFPHYKYQEVATYNGRFQLTYVDQKNGGEDWHSGGSDVPLDRWFLLEWEFNDDPDMASVWVDGEKVYDTPFTFGPARETANLVGGFVEAGFGFRLWGAAPSAFDIYYDDIAIDTNRIGPIK